MMKNPLKALNNLNTWWSLSKEEQSDIASTVPTQSTWQLYCTKHESGVWVFSLPQFKTINESFCNGTELVLDAHYKLQTGVEAKVGDEMLFTVSDKKLPKFTTTQQWLNKDPYWFEANYFLDSVTNLQVWLCPYLQVLFKSVPETLWVLLEPVGATLLEEPLSYDEMDKYLNHYPNVQNDYFGDYLVNKKEPPKDAIPGVWCHFPIHKYYLLPAKKNEFLNYLKTLPLNQAIKMFDCIPTTQAKKEVITQLSN